MSHVCPMYHNGVQYIPEVSQMCLMYVLECSKCLQMCHRGVICIPKVSHCVLRAYSVPKVCQLCFVWVPPCPMSAPMCSKDVPMFAKCVPCVVPVFSRSRFTTNYLVGDNTSLTGFRLTKTKNTQGTHWYILERIFGTHWDKSQTHLAYL